MSLVVKVKGTFIFRKGRCYFIEIEPILLALWLFFFFLNSDETSSPLELYEFIP
jgi:hypothetical protein